MIPIPPATPLLAQLPGTSREPFLHGLELGQILQASVLSENHDGQIELLIGGNKLIAQSPLRFTTGQSLTLQVDKTGPLPELKLLSPTDPQRVQTEALKRVLPRQRPLSVLFERLLHFRSSSSHGSPPGEIKQAIQELVERLISVEHPHFRQDLKTALLDSGLFAERHLVNRGPHGNDLKLNLLKLYELIKRLMPQPGLAHDRKAAPDPGQDPATHQSQGVFKQLTDLVKLLDGAIARIQTNQLASLPRDDSTHQTWQFELPLLYKDRVDLYQITVKQEDGGSRADPTTAWSLTLQMNLQPLGPMRVQLRLRGKALSAVLWAERQGTMQLLERRLPELRQAFEQADLEVTRLQAYQSKIATPELLPRVSGLLSEKV